MKFVAKSLLGAVALVVAYLWVSTTDRSGGRADPAQPAQIPAGARGDAVSNSETHQAASTDDSQRKPVSADPTGLASAKAVELLVDELRNELAKWKPHRVELRESGVLIASGEMLNGQRHGDWTEFHPDGTTKALGRYIEGTRWGEWKTFDASGQLLTKGLYLDGKRHGPWWIRSADGQLAYVSMEFGEQASQ